MVSISTELPLDVDSVMNETWTGDGLPEWNPNINFAHTVASPTSHFDVITCGNNDVLIVSGRDFLFCKKIPEHSNRIYYGLAQCSTERVSRAERKSPVSNNVFNCGLV
ncbi:hypothetical protein OSTOST_16485, partial [Ostertagia ostertagi]